MNAGIKKNHDRRKGVYLLPNALTTAALFCGFYSMIQAIQGNFYAAAWAILFAGVFDALDGRVARLTHTYSDFGIQYDSLADLAGFGLAPALLAYTWTLHHFGKIGWAAAFLYFACAALRLARYNTQIDNVERKHFQGLPTPSAAFMLASYVIFYTQLKGSGEVASFIMMMMTVGLGLLMVSNVRYRSFKNLHLTRRASFLFLVGVAIFIFIVASEPNIMIFLFSSLYVVCGLVEESIFQLRKQRPSTDPLLSNPEDSPLEAESLRVIDGKIKA